MGADGKSRRHENVVTFATAPPVTGINICIAQTVQYKSTCSSSSHTNDEMFAPLLGQATKTQRSRKIAKNEVENNIFTEK